LLKLAFVIALVFSPFAAAIAFVITYSEYAKHFVDKKKALKKALGMALVAFIFFLIVPPLVIWILLGS